MKQKILQLIDDYCKFAKSQNRYPAVISRATLSVELKNAGINFAQAVSIILELETEKKIFSYRAVNDIMYHTEGYGLYK